MISKTPLWSNDAARKEWHLEVDREKKKCDADPTYCPSGDFMAQSSKFGPTEVAVAAPWRSGILADIFLNSYRCPAFLIQGP